MRGEPLNVRGSPRVAFGAIYTEGGAIMARDVSIEVSLIDRVSPQFNNMTKASTAFRKDLEETLKVLVLFSKTKISAQVSLKMDDGGVLKTLKSAEEQSLKTSGAFEDLSAKINNTDFSPINSGLEETNKKAQDTAKSISQLGTAISKENNKPADKSLTDKAIGDTSKVKDFLKSGVLNMLGDSVGNLASTYLTSAIGNEGKTVGSTVSGAISGAVMGSVVPGIGTAVGAVIGGVAGFINAEAEKFAAEDDAFKTVKQQLYNDVVQSRQATIQKGTAIAAQREIDEVAFSQLIKGEISSSEFLGQIKTMANYTPFSYEDLTSMAKSLSPALGNDPQKMLEWMTNIGDMGAALGLGASDMNLIAKNMGEMKLTGKVTMESLDPLLDYNIDVWSYLKDNFEDGKTGEKLTQEELIEAVSKGELNGADVADAISAGMKEAYSGSSGQQNETYSGLLNTLQGLQDDIDYASGEGFIEKRKEGVQAEIDSLSGEAGERAKEANKLIGEYYASLENQKEQYNRETRDFVMGAIDESGLTADISPEAMEELIKKRERYRIAMAKQSGDEAGNVLAETQSLAIMEYNNSTGAKNEINSQIELARRIGGDLSLHEEYWNSGYLLGNELSKGMLEATANSVQGWLEMLGSAWDETTGGAFETDPETGAYTVDANSLFGSLADRIQESWHSFLYDEDFWSVPSFDTTGKAFGMNYVPYDNFPALLHQGERVLTASEARQADRGNGNITVNVNGNFSVRNDGDARLIAQEIVSEFMAVQSVM